MSLGAVSTYAETRDTIIADALANVGAIGPGMSVSDGNMQAHAARALNRLVKSMDADGMGLWKIVRRTATTTATIDYFTPATDVLDIDGSMSYLPAAGGGRTLVYPMTRADYMALADRTVAGTPTRYFTEKVVSGASAEALTVTLWSVPDTTGDTIEYAAVIRRLDFTTGANQADAPQRWMRAYTLGLSADLAYPYAQPDLADRFMAQFQAERDKQLGNDNERGPLVFVPFGGSY